MTDRPGAKPSRRVAEECVRKALKGRKIIIFHNEPYLNIGDSPNLVIRRVSVRTGKRKTVEVFVSFDRRTERGTNRYKVFWDENGKEKDTFVVI